MSLAKKCDRCGNLYEPKAINIRGELVNGLRLINRKEDNTTAVGYRYFDLCPQCLVSLSDWFKNQPVCLTFNEIRIAAGLEPIKENKNAEN